MRIPKGGVKTLIISKDEETTLRNHLKKRGEPLGVYHQGRRKLWLPKSISKNHKKEGEEETRGRFIQVKGNKKGKKRVGRMLFGFLPF